jgi:hypothetical protein
MNLTIFPLLIVALLMMSGNPDVETAQLMMTGDHRVESQDGALIVGEAMVTIPAGAEVPGPIYVIGGELTVIGAVTGDVVQLAGTVTVESGAIIGNELQHVAGTLVISNDAEIGRRTNLELTGGTGDLPIGGVLPGAVLTVLLAGVGYLMTKKRRGALDNVAAAVAGHPVVTFTVGLLLTLTFVSVFVFMALTLLLIPVAVLGIVAGLLTLGYGIIAWGHLVGARLPISDRRVGSVVGVVLVTMGIQLAGLVPLIGDLIVAAILLTGLGAVVVTYYGVSGFRPVTLPD